MSQMMRGVDLESRAGTVRGSTSSAAPPAGPVQSHVIAASAVIICVTIMSEPLLPQRVREIVGVELTDQEADGLAAWYAGLARGVAAFSATDLKRVEPPLRSVPGPTA